ncbi:MAG: trehalose 6-phosphate synthase [Chitinivibrionales bacterium]|nr:trehalose 6-phosphate synthase [Chitinivibrionales bacterium]
MTVQNITSKPEIRTLKSFYDLMQQTCEIRKRCVSAILEDTAPNPQDITSLQNALHLLEEIPVDDQNHAVVALDENRNIAIDLAYEAGELRKDIRYLINGEQALYDYFTTLHDSFEEQVRKGVEILSPVDLRSFVSDRDGTVNNYCGRYLSSIQSIYNAVFLIRFARKVVRKSVVLTSAPLNHGGIIDIATTPLDTIVYAGSKGREYWSLSQERKAFAIPAEQQKKLNDLTQELRSFVSTPVYEKFSLIGSGFQHKFGQLTIARQDITHSISEEESSEFLDKVRGIVAEHDPDKNTFRIEDTGLDIEITLTLDDAAHGHILKEFDKGDGVLFLDSELDLALYEGPNLVCGDTNGDVPMARVCAEKTDKTWTIFVTDDDALKEKVARACKNHHFVSQPDMLVTILYELSKKNTK